MQHLAVSSRLFFCVLSPHSPPSLCTHVQKQDSTYFNLAIAPILRSMPQQKLKVLAELQVRKEQDLFVGAGDRGVERMGRNRGRGTGGTGGSCTAG